ncbi:hypothetical protein QBC38DRAFT_490293 [Podospora fimiseda]|uniref:Uncharacterized protein n=1 Tax=Podospora fimiseda TaxID=252190 RepID=A0AAN6YMZ4_9PEZI|nr:hypothetical protein QBC38DRAFT_490293 [Podospora fimiseda]
MAYSADINFILEPTDQFLVPHRDDLYFSDDGWALSIKKWGAEYVIFNGTEEVGLEDCKCVVVGTLDDNDMEEDVRKDYYILVIRDKHGDISQDKNAEKGVETVQARFVSIDCTLGTLW